MTDLLRVSDLSVTYGNASAVSCVSFGLAAGRVLAVLGANGAGKSSLGRAICGITPKSGGTVHLDGVDVSRVPPSRIARAGLAYLPEGRGIFPGLSVNDNLKMFARIDKSGSGGGLDRAYELFPRLRERHRQIAGTLSGGEQQMLALARVLMVRPKVVVADEPSLGLAPLLIDMVFEALATAREAGTTLVLIEQYVHRALAVADDVLILRHGAVAWRGAAEEIGDDVLAHYAGQEPVPTGGA